MPATDAARRAAVLLKVYAHRIDGQAAANKRIAQALGSENPEHDEDTGEKAS